MEHEVYGDTNSNWRACNNPQGLVKGTGRVRNQRMSGDHPDCSIIEIGQNTEKSPEDLRIFAVTQTLVKRWCKKKKLQGVTTITITIIRLNAMLGPLHYLRLLDR